MSGPILAAHHLTKRFHLHLLDGREVAPVVDLNFTVNAGAHFLISGRSGAGKTSILRCIYRTYLIDEGAIWYDSTAQGQIDLAAASEGVILWLREHEIGYCSQFLKVLPRVPAIDIISEPLLRRGTAPEEARDIGAAWLKRLHINERLWGASPLTFSGGEQQRLNLARAFIALPRLLLLDEPTASLDGQSKSIVIDLIREAHQQGVTIVTVSHDLDAIEDLADQRLILEA